MGPGGEAVRSHAEATRAPEGDVVKVFTAHSLLSSGLASVNALSQSIFEYRRREKRSTNRFTPATAVKHVKKIETKNKNVT